jgi:predicted kinase
MKEHFARFVRTWLGPETVLITCGLPATWKTETAEEVQRIKGYRIIRTDLVRLEVLKGEDVFDEKVASDWEKRQKVYDEVFRRAEEVIANGQGVIIDATFITHSLRRRAAEIAARHNRPFVIMQTSCPQEVSLNRIAKRTKENYESNAITDQAYLSNKERFEKIDIHRFKLLYPNLHIMHFIVDTEYDPPEKWFVITMHVE